jgi:hypothetical protein
LGHLCYVKMDCNCLVHSRAWNETAWVRESTHLLLKG